MHPLLGPDIQFGIMVRDIRAEMNRWFKDYGIGPFCYMKDISLTDAVYKGQQVNLRLDCALAYRGDGVQIELIQPLDDTPSPWTEFLSEGREGIHHFGFWPDDEDAAEEYLQSLGLSPLFSVVPGDAPRASHYYPDPGGTGALIEIIEGGKRKRDFYDRVKTLSREGDKTGPAWTETGLFGSAR